MGIVSSFIKTYQYGITHALGATLSLMNLIIAFIFLGQTCGDATTGISTLQSQDDFDGRAVIIDALQINRGKL